MDDQNYKDAYSTIKNNLAAKGRRQGGLVDPQNNTCQDTISFPQYIKLTGHLQKSAIAERIRDRSIYTHMYSSVGRADEGRMVYLADMVAPREMTCIGESPHHLSAAPQDGCTIVGQRFCPLLRPRDLCLHGRLL